jgi:hypothetical protein
MSIPSSMPPTPRYSAEAAWTVRSIAQQGLISSQHAAISAAAPQAIRKSHKAINYRAFCHSYRRPDLARWRQRRGGSPGLLLYARSPSRGNMACARLLFRRSLWFSSRQPSQLCSTPVGSTLSFAVSQKARLNTTGRLWRPWENSISCCVEQSQRILRIPLRRPGQHAQFATILANENSGRQTQNFACLF